MRSTFMLSLASALLLSGCFFESNDHVVVDGTLVVDWTVDGLKDPAECRQAGADGVDVVVRTYGGHFVGEYREACSAFSTSIDLAPGGYDIDAVLVDRGGVVLTTSATDSQRVHSDETSVSAIAFPADSFL